MESQNRSEYDAWKRKRKSKPNAIQRDQKKAETLKSEVPVESLKLEKWEEFEKLPISAKTKSGLRKHGYLKPTSIQQAAIPTALQNKDVLGAAKTGSGKTLAFIIPVLECLFKNNWNNLDGPGALIISPTRELAYQIFDVLRKVGCKHTFSAGLVIGGTKLKEESHHLCRTNIIVSTPGRLLQHLDETSYFNFDNLKVLVLDEADRILDMGFRSTLNAILENLPNTRQTLLFSATQTRSVKDLAMLSLQDPVLVSVHAESLHSTPAGLKQRYLVCDLSNKLNILYSFIRTHLKCKVLVFVSSCKQVLYMYSLLCKLRPGIPLLHLHGRMNQQRRMLTYQEFCRKQFVVLISTDLAARGLDFPKVNWVVQLDCPEDAETYIHRAGRTARFHEHGNSLLVLLNSEKEEMLKELKKLNVPIEGSEINLDKLVQTRSWFQSFCAQDKELKERAQRCFVSYIKSVHLMKNKKIFSVENLPLQAYAESLGLAFPPRLRFLQRKFQEGVEKGSGLLMQSDKGKPIDDFAQFGNEDDECEDSLFSIAKVSSFSCDMSNELPFKQEIDDKVNHLTSNKKTSKAATAKRMLKKGLKLNQKIKYDEAGEVSEAWPPLEENHKGSLGGIDINQAKALMKVRDEQDREKQQIKIKEKHKQARLKAKQERKLVHDSREGVDAECQLGSGDSGDGSGSDNEQSDPGFSYQTTDLAVDEDDFDQSIISTDDDNESEDTHPVHKRRKVDTKYNPNVMLTLQEKEDLALQLLHS